MFVGGVPGRHQILVAAERPHNVATPPGERILRWRFVRAEDAWGSNRIWCCDVTDDILGDFLGIRAKRDDPKQDRGMSLPGIFDFELLLDLAAAGERMLIGGVGDIRPGL